MTDEKRAFCGAFAEMMMLLSGCTAVDEAVSQIGDNIEAGQLGEAPASASLSATAASARMICNDSWMQGGMV